MGPRVACQTPFSPFFIGRGSKPPGMSVVKTPTDSALGAWTRNVTFRSVPTSGDTTTGPLGPLGCAGASPARVIAARTAAAAGPIVDLGNFIWVLPFRIGKDGKSVMRIVIRAGRLPFRCRECLREAPQYRAKGVGLIRLKSSQERRPQLLAALIHFSEFPPTIWRQSDAARPSVAGMRVARYKPTALQQHEHGPNRTGVGTDESGEILLGQSVALGEGGQQDELVGGHAEAGQGSVRQTVHHEVSTPQRHCEIVPGTHGFPGKILCIRTSFL